MNLVITLVVLTLGCGTRVVVNGAVNYAGIPYNVYGNTASVQQSYLRSPIQYGAHQQSPNSVPVRRGYYPAVQPRAYAPVHPRAYAPVQPRVYAPVHPRAYAPVQPRTYAPVHPRVYAPQPRTYAPVHPSAYAPVHPRVYAPQPRTYAPVHPRVYAPVHPRVYAPQPRSYAPVHPTAYAPAQLRSYAPVSPRTYAPAQLKAYAPASAATRTYGQQSSRYPSNVKPRVAYYVPARQPISNAAAVRQPISNAFLRQPIRNVAVQRPVSRTLPKVQWYRNAPMSVPYSQGYAAAQRSGVPVRLVAYGRNHIARASSRNTPSKKPIKAANRQKISPPAISKNTNIKINNNALNKKPNAVFPQMTQVVRNHINGIVFPSKTVLVAKERTAIQPTKPSSDSTHPTGQKLSSFLKNVKNFRDTLKGDTMKQGLIYYNDDVSNKTRHRPTNFAQPTRKLGSQGAPGGSRVSLSIEDKTRPETASKAVSQIGSERDTIKEIGENNAGEIIPGENTREEKIPRERIPGEKPPGERTPGERTPGERTPGEKTPREKIPRERILGEKTPREKIPRERIPGEKTPEERTPAEKTPVEKTPRDKIPRERIPGEITPGEKTPGEKTPGEKTPGEKIPRERIPGEKSPREKIHRERIPGERTPGENIPREKIPREKSPGNLSQTGQSNITSSGEKVESLGTNGERKMASHFDNPKVDLGLLKEKVLHSNNSQFLKRVLQVLKKYTKLMKSSMAEKNMTSLRPGASVKDNGSNTSSPEVQKQNSSAKASRPEKVDAKLKSVQARDPFTELNKNLMATSENKNDSQLEDNPLALANGFNSTSTAIKIFDLLNKASKLNSEKLIKKGASHTNTAKGKSESQKSNSDSNAKDENASKKGKIETEHNLGKPVFNLMKLQNGLERGNTIK